MVPSRSIGLALSWEFWRRRWAWILTAPAVMAVLPSLVYGALWREGFSTFDGTETGRMLHVAFFMCSLFYICTGVVWRQNDLFQRFVLPVSTPALVGWNVINGVVSAALMYLGLAGLLNLMFDVGWPLWGPALLAATTAACAQAVIWSFNNSRAMQVGFGLFMACTIGWWIGARYGSDPSWVPPNATKLWTSVTLGEVATMGGAMVAAYVLAVVGVSRLRRGEGVDLERLWRRIAELRGRFAAAAGPRSFPTAASAQLWLEWQQRGKPYPVAALLVSVCVILLCTSPWIDAQEGLDIVAGFSTILLVAALPAGMFIGHRSESHAMGSFDATRPLPDGQLASAILKNAARSTLLAAATWGTGAMLALAWFVVSGEGEAVLSKLRAGKGPYSAGYLSVAILLGAGLLAAWTLVGLGASLTLARRWLMATILYAGLTSFFAYWLLVTYAVARDLRDVRDLRDQLDTGLTWVFGIGCVLATACAFGVARRLRLISTTTLGIALAIWLLLSGGFIATAILPRGPGTPLVIVLFLGLFSLPIAPVATAPIALWWNRHR